MDFFIRANSGWSYLVVCFEVFSSILVCLAEIPNTVRLTEGLIPILINDNFRTCIHCLLRFRLRLVSCPPCLMFLCITLLAIWVPLILGTRHI